MRGTRTSLTRRWYDEGFYGRETVRDRVERAVERWGDRPVVVWSWFRSGETTLGEMHGRGRRLAGSLHDLGLRAGDVVAAQMPNWVEAGVVYHACVELGLVVLPIIHVYGRTEVDHILRSSKAKAMVSPSVWGGIDYSDRAYPERHPGLTWVVVGEDRPASAVAFEDLEAKGHDRWPWPEIDADDVHVTNYTSGTTAEPKGVLHSHNSLLAEVHAQLASTDDVEGREVMVSPNPAGHIAGLLSNFLFAAITGQKIVMMDGWDPGACLELIETHRATKAGGAPFFLSGMLDHPDLATRDLSSLRLFGCGGAGVPPALIEKAAAHGIFSFRSYGSTEHPSITQAYMADPVEWRAHTDGRPQLGVRLRIVDGAGAEVPAGTPGEILTIGPDMCVGYRDEAHNTAFDADGWYHTGDVGVIDGNGCLAITDRIKDIIIRGGENISAREVEEVLAAHPKVMEAAAVAMPDARYGERVCACVVVRNESDPLTFDEMTEHFRSAGIARQKTPERLEVVPELPRTLAGKVQKFKLRERLAEGR